MEDVREVELPANWTPFICTQENILRVWEKLNQFPILFDDLIRGDFKHFVNELIAERSVILLTGNYGIVRLCNIIPKRSGEVHLAFWDRRFKGRLEEVKQALIWAFMKLDLVRVEATIPSIAHATANFLRSIGFKREGCIRKCMLYKGSFLDSHIYGILREDLLDRGNKEDTQWVEEEDREVAH